MAICPLRDPLALLTADAAVVEILILLHMSDLPSFVSVAFVRIKYGSCKAAGKNATEAGHARAKAEADIALSLPAEYRDSKNDTRAEY